jgi:hypothetical protein
VGGGCQPRGPPRGWLGRAQGRAAQRVANLHRPGGAAGASRHLLGLPPVAQGQYSHPGVGAALGWKNTNFFLIFFFNVFLSFCFKKIPCTLFN